MRRDLTSEAVWEQVTSITPRLAAELNVLEERAHPVTSNTARRLQIRVRRVSSSTPLWVARKDGQLVAALHLFQPSFGPSIVHLTVASQPGLGGADSTWLYDSAGSPGKVLLDLAFGILASKGALEVVVICRGVESDLLTYLKTLGMERMTFRVQAVVAGPVAQP